MEVVYKHCAGLDVHKRTVVACVILSDVASESGTKPSKEIRTFNTMTADLLNLSDFLTARQVTHVAMESTGVYWKPIWNLLEANFSLILANAAHIKAVPGRKTDVKDSEWIADLARHGLIIQSFVPDRDQRETRELTRYRTSLVQERASEVNRLAKTLEGANIKLGSVATDITGVSARAMLQRLVSGSTDEVEIASLAKGRLREKTKELEQALRGVMGPHQRFMIAQQLDHIDDLETRIATISEEVIKRQLPFEEDIQRLDTIPGVGRRTAEIIIAELGNNMAQFPTPEQAAAWAGVAPGNNESAGKRRSGKSRQGNPALRAALVEAANAAARTKNTYLRARYHRIATRRGHKIAVVAIAHTILVIAYRLLQRKEEYRELGQTHGEQRSRETKERRLVKQLTSLGYAVTRPNANAAA